MKTKNILPLLFLTLFCWQSSAGVYLRPSFGYLINEDDGGTSKTTKTTTQVNLAAGYSLSKGFSLGVNRMDYTEKTKYTSSTYNSETELKFSGLGFGAGFISQKDAGYFFMAHYIPDLEFEYGTSSIEYEGNGLLIELGYKVRIKKLGIGLHLAYQTFKAKPKNTIYGTTEQKYSDLFPAFDIWVMF